MDILLTMVKLHELSDIYIPDAKDRLFRQYLTAFAGDINAYALLNVTHRDRQQRCHCSACW